MRKPAAPVRVADLEEIPAGIGDILEYRNERVRMGEKDPAVLAAVHRVRRSLIGVRREGHHDIVPLIVPKQDLEEFPQQLSQHGAEGSGPGCGGAVTEPKALAVSGCGEAGTAPTALT